MTVLNALSKIFDEDETNTPHKPEKPFTTMYADITHVIGIVPKVDWIEYMLCTLVNMKPVKIPNLEWKTEVNEIPISTYSVDILARVLALFKEYEHVSVKLRKDFPVAFECDDFIAVVSPYVDDYVDDN